LATAFAIEGFSATHRTLVTILQGMVLRGFVSSHRIEEADSLLSLGLGYTRMSCNYCVEVKDLESKVPGASGSRATFQHRPHQRAPSPSDFTLSRASSSSDIYHFTSHQCPSVINLTDHMSASSCAFTEDCHQRRTSRAISDVHSSHPSTLALVYRSAISRSTRTFVSRSQGTS
jgi:hypothetical protein